MEALSGMVQGPLQFIPPNGSGEGSLRVGTKTIPLAEVMIANFGGKREEPSGALVLLRNGDELSGELTGGDENQIRLKTFALRAGDGSPEIPIPLEAMLGLGFPGNFPDGKGGLSWIHRRFWGKGSPRSQGSPPGGGDRIFLTEETELAGVLQKIDLEGIHFQSATAGEIKLPLEKVRLLQISQEPLKAGEDREGGPPGAEGITSVVQFQDGSLLSGKLLRLNVLPEGSGPREGPTPPAGAVRGEIRILVKALGEVTAAPERVRRLSFRGGRCRYLSDLVPKKISHRKDVFSGIYELYEMGRDLSILGGPITLRGQVYRKGLGMLSHTRADYDLGGLYSRFQAVIGMDDSARPDVASLEEKKGGTAVFRILVDGRAVFEKELSPSDPPLPVEIPLDGAKELSLELDVGPFSFYLDHGDWADARIVKKN